jgi:molybdopterin molybdotransferase
LPVFFEFVMITVEKALEHILSRIMPLGQERVSLLDGLGRILAEDCVSRWSIPPRDNSAMDGFAVRTIDVAGAGIANPVRLAVVEEIPAGHVPRRALNRMEAAKIMTGAPIPPGADAVIRREDLVEEGRQILVTNPVPAGQDIRSAGEDIRAGEVAVSRGELLRPAEIGLLASLGRSMLTVYQRPVVAIVATGNELVDVDEPPAEGHIVTSNSYSLAAQVRECGAIPLLVGIARDTKEDILTHFRHARQADAIITSGGVSVGDYDLVRTVIESNWRGIQFWQVAMRPGKPFAFGDIEGKPFFGLPGNPVSTMVSFEQFVRPALLKMMGWRHIFRRLVKAKTLEKIKKKRGVTHFLRAMVTLEEGGYGVRTTGEQGSGILKSMVMANGLVIVPADVKEIAVGEEVWVQLIDASLIQAREIVYPS